LAAWVAHRERRVTARTALKNQLLGQVDRAFPGVGGCVSSLFGTKVGRLVLAEFTDPARLGALGVAGVQQAAAERGVQVLAPVAERLVAAATVAIPTDQAPMARTIIDRDLSLLAAFDAQVAEADKHLAALLPRTPFAVLCSGPGWRVVRAATYAAAVGDPARWPSARILYRASGLYPAPTPRPAAAMTAPSAGKARSPCGGPCCRWGGAVAAGPRRPRLRRLPAGPRQAAWGDRHRHGEPGQPHRLRHGQRPTTLRPRPVEVIRDLPLPVGRARLVGWEAGSDTAGDLAGQWSRRSKLGARPPVIQQNPDEVS
jgi:hypothetical protein